MYIYKKDITINWNYLNIIGQRF